MIKINMFEGARRVVKLMAVMWVMGVCNYEFTTPHTVSAYFHMDSPSSVPMRMSEQERSCDKGDERPESSQFSRETSNGTHVSVTLCFTPLDVALKKSENIFAKMEAEDLKNQLSTAESPVTKPNPFADIIAEGKAKAAVSATEFDPYAVIIAKRKADQDAVDNFKLSKLDEEWADTKARWKSIKEGALIAIGGMVFLWVFSWVVGWIVRGFAGIPLGCDRKTEER